MTETDISKLGFNPFDKIGREWFLIAAGDRDGYNMMTASWGFMGVMWGKPSVQIVVRPTRYTYDFLNKHDIFTLSWFDEKYRDALSFCGSNSGRDVDKTEKTGLTPVFTDGSVAFEESSLTLVCRKVFTMPMDKNGLDESVDAKWNSKDPIHCEFIGEIIKVYEG